MTERKSPLDAAREGDHEEVVEVLGGRIASVVAFLDTSLFAPFELSATLAGQEPSSCLPSA